MVYVIIYYLRKHLYDLQIHIVKVFITSYDYVVQCLTSLNSTLRITMERIHIYSFAADIILI